MVEPILTLSLPLSSVNIILKSMHEQPYALVVKVVADVEAQAKASLEPKVDAEKDIE